MKGLARLPALFDAGEDMDLVVLSAVEDREQVEAVSGIVDAEVEDGGFFATQRRPGRTSGLSVP